MFRLFAASDFFESALHETFEKIEPPGALLEGILDYFFFIYASII